MAANSISTAPKPFIFVLMPFEDNFNDIYTFGIKGAAEDVGAYAERVDEQIFSEGILDRIFNQINKADIIVADMTGRNPNVFYEVGYAHALGKIVLLLTQDADDIPFDLKHHQHTVYGGKIKTLKTELAKRLAWGINEAKKQQLDKPRGQFEVIINGTEVPEKASSQNPPRVLRVLEDEFDIISFVIRNGSFELSPSISHIYLFSSWQSSFSFYKPVRGGHAHIGYLKAHPSDAKDGLERQSRLDAHVSHLPPGASETFNITVKSGGEIVKQGVEELFRLRFHTEHRFHDFVFKLAAEAS